jgi:hypothetical protein
MKKRDSLDTMDALTEKAGSESPPPPKFAEGEDTRLLHKMILKI